MANVAVQKVSEEKNLPASWFDAIEKSMEQIRAKAFGLFEESGRQDGHDFDQWLEAERQLMSVPRTELSDTGAAFELCIDTPEYQAKQIDVNALPNCILVKAEASREKETKEGEVRRTELSEQSLFRRIPLSTPVDVDKVTAALDKGVLKIVAPKKVDAKDKTVGKAATA